MNFENVVPRATPFLSKQAPTHWGSAEALCDSIIINEVHLTAIFNAAGFVSDGRDRERNSINNPEFALNLRKICKILQPVCGSVVRFQRDSVPVSEV